MNQTQYSNPVLRLIFLRHATTRFNLVAAEIAQDLPTRGKPCGRINFTQRAAIYLPEKTRYENLVALEESEDIGKAINDVVGLIEEEVELLRGAAEYVPIL